MKLNVVIAASLAFSLTACSETEEVKEPVTEKVVETVKEEVKEIEPLRAEHPGDIHLREGLAFLEENASKEGVTVLESGVQYEVMIEGDGAIPTMENNVTVHYHGTHLDGSVFDSSVDRNEPFTHNMNDPLITGWVEALLHMPLGSKWKVFMPNESAYGAFGSPPAIGPNEALIFEIELISING